MHGRSMRSRTKLAREIQLTDWSTPGNLSNWSSGVQIPRDTCICTYCGCYLYSMRCSGIIINNNEIGEIVVEIVVDIYLAASRLGKYPPLSPTLR